MEALADVVGAEARADGAFLDDVHRRGQRAGAQQQGGIVGFRRRHAAGNLHTTAADFGADHRRRNDFTLALFDEQDGHALADVFTRDILEDAGAGCVQHQMHRRFLRLVVEAGLGIGQALAGQYDLFLDQQATAATFDVILGAGRRLAVRGGLQGGRVGAGLVIDHPDFQGGRATEDVLGLGGVLYARQLYDDAVGPLLLNDRLGNAQFVDAVVQRGDVLLDGEFLDALLCGGLERGDQFEIGAILGFEQVKVGLAFGDGDPCLVAHFGVAEADRQRVALTADTAMTDVLVAQQGAQVGAGRVESLGQRALHVQPAAGSAHRRAGQDPGTSARHSSPSASRARRTSRLSATL